MSEEKFSQFAIGAAIVDTDEAVGIQISDSDNAKWNFQQVKTYVLNDQVVQTWDGSSVPVNVTAGTSIDITGGTISFTGDISVDMQDTYDNSVSGGNAIINLTDTYPLQINSTTEVSRPVPSMTFAETGVLVNPINGGIVWQTDSARLAVNRGTPATPNFDQVAYLDDIAAIEEDVIYGEAFFQGNSTETVISAINTPVKVNATYSSGELQGFTQVNGTLTYTENVTRVFSASVSLTASMDLVSADITVYIVKNGAVIAKSGQNPFLGGVSPAFVPISVQCLVSLDQTDTIEIFVENNTNTDNITVQDLNAKVHTIGGTESAADQVVIQWDGSTSPVSVVGGTDIDITGGTISYTGTGEANVVQSWDGFATPVDVTAGTGITITGGVITATGDQSVTLQDAYDNGNTIQISNANTFPVLIEGNGSNALLDKAHIRMHDPSLTLNSGDTTGRITFSATDVASNVVELVRVLPKIENISDITPRGSLTYQLWENSWITYLKLNGQLSNITAYKQFDFNENVNFLQKVGLNAGVPDASSVFDARSTTAGMLDPRMTDAQFTAISSKATALRAYTTDDDRFTVQTSGGKEKFAYLSDVPASGNFPVTLGTAITPAFGYTSGVWGSIIGTLNGTNVVGANTMVQGSTVEFEFSGTIVPVTTGGTGQLRVLWAGAVQATSQVLNYNSITGTFNCHLKFSVTMSGINTFNATVAAWAEDSSNQMVPLQMYINPLNKAFDPTIANAIDVEYLANFGVGNSVDLLARNLTIVKYN